MKLTNITGKENPIHAYEKEEYRIKFNISFLATTDRLRNVLRLLYQSAIGPSIYPEVQVANLYDDIDNLYELLDWAWLAHLERQKHAADDVEPEIIDDSIAMFSDYSVDSCYPRLQYAFWIRERRERYNGNVVHLNQLEVYNENLFFTAFFEQKSLREWKATLEKWLEFALAPEQNIIDEGFATAYQAFMDLEQLEKLVEMCWLSLKQDEELNDQDLRPWFNKENYPVFILMDGAFNPYEEIYFFHYYDSLNMIKRKINTWFAAVLSEEKVWEGVAAELIFFYKQLGTLMECCWVVKELGPNHPKEWNRIRTTSTKERAADVSDKHKFKLEVAHLKKPANYLQEFFAESNLNDYRYLLFECLYASLGKEVYYPFGPDEIKDFHIKLIKLVETAYLIQRKKFKNKKTEGVK